MFPETQEHSAKVMSSISLDFRHILRHVSINLACHNTTPGAWIIEQYIPGIMQTGYEALAMGIINGVIYGVIIWFIFTIAKMLYDRMQGPKEVVVKVEKKDE